MKVAIITGGTSGIGLACAERLLADGFGVAIAGRNHERLRDAVAGLDAQRTLAVSADVAVPADCARIVEDAVQRFGQVDAVVNAAGIYETAPLEGMDVAAWDRILNANLRGAWLVTSAALPHLKLQANSAVVNISSINALMAEAQAAAYSASKAALSSLTQTMAIEWAHLGVRVNAVAPGVISTPMSDEWLAGMPAEEISSTFPMGRLGEASEVADLVAFLCSSRSSYLSGEVIRLDGAMLSRIPGTH